MKRYTLLMPILVLMASFLAAGGALAQERASVEKVFYYIEEKDGDTVKIKQILLENNAKDFPTKILRFEAVLKGSHDYNVLWTFKPSVRQLRLSEVETEDAIKDLYPDANTSRSIAKKELQPGTEYSLVISAPKKLGHIVPFSIKFSTAPKQATSPTAN